MEQRRNFRGGLLIPFVAKMHPDGLRSPVIYTLCTGDVQLTRQGQLQQLLKCLYPKTANGSELHPVDERVLS